MNSDPLDSNIFLSTFGERLLAVSPTPYVVKRAKFFPIQYAKDSKPDGKILLCTAENKLLSSLLIERLQATLKDFPIPTYVLNYTDPTGIPSFREEIARFFTDFFCKDVVVAIPAKQLVLGAGCVSLLTALSLLLFEPNEAVLIPAPYYPAFDHDFYNFAQAVVCPVNCCPTDECPFGLLTEDALEAAYSEAARKGFAPKGLLISNPNNPLGTLYSPDELLAAIRFVRKYPHLHLIMDEIYALSVFPPFCRQDSLDELRDNRTKRFVSVLELLGGQLGENIHIVWSFSKDFAGSGLRVGVLHTQNEKLLQAMPSCVEPMMASNLTQHCLEVMIGDRDFVSHYLQKNREALYRSYRFLAEELAALSIPVVEAQGAIFVFADFRAYLSADASFAEELALFEHLADIGGVVLTPGESCRCTVPGYFRICYAFVDFETLEVAMDRLKTCLQQWSRSRPASK